MHGQRILEAGSGAGRFTEVLLGTGADVISFDYSTAVDANYKNNGTSGNLNLFQGDIFNIPLEQGSFDKVFCLGVLQHTPDPAAGFASLTQYVRPGGELAVDAYTRNFAAWVQWKYLLRPITKRMEKQTLYNLIEILVPILLPMAKVLRKIAGRAGARLIPIVEYSHLGLSHELNMRWAMICTLQRMITLSHSLMSGTGSSRPVLSKLMFVMDQMVLLARGRSQNKRLMNKMRVIGGYL